MLLSQISPAKNPSLTSASGTGGAYQDQRLSGAPQPLGQVFPEDQVEFSTAAKAGAKAEALTSEEQQQVEKLKQRDQQVRTHEMAHMAAGGSVVSGGPYYQYAIGPDNKQYVVNGHVDISVAPERDPEATIRKMEQVQSAALAPADPSPEDRSVAAHAASLENSARQQLRQEKTGSKINLVV